MSAPQHPGPEALTEGAAALERADWGAARAVYERVAAASETAEAWEGLSRATWWLGDRDATMDARERAYRGYRRAGDACGAARMAMWLGSDHLDFDGDDALSAAWLTRGRSLVDDCDPCAEQGWIALMDANNALRSDPAEAERLAQAALVLAREVGTVDVEVVALAILGYARIVTGSVDAGRAFLEESAALAVAEEFDDAIAPGWALCHAVTALTDVGDFGRAAQWSRAMHAWSERWQGRNFFGACRMAYGRVLATRGDWPSAEDELTAAMDDMRTTRPAMAASTAVRLADLRMRQGALDEARALFESALPRPQAVLGLGQLDLDRGDTQAAVEAAERVLRRLGQAGELDRLPALELLARARASAGDPEGADEAATRAERDADALGTDYMRARGRLVRAEVLCAAGDSDGARQAAEDAIDLFGACSAPYETARARLLLATALRQLGRPDRAEVEASSARETLALLGARGEGGQGGGEELTLREAEVLRLVARGLSDAQIAERLFLSPHTVHRHIANVRTKLGTPSRAAAVAYATRNGLL